MTEKIMIGLETHVQLNTKTKLFCGCALEGVASAGPNTRTCDTCLGLPGSKPRTNAAALEKAIRIALALGCEIPKETYFSRKSYFYPDMSKNFQITQYEVPLAKKGSIRVGEKTIGIRRINVEEDPAKLVHVGGLANARYVLADYNRSGIPLCEIVTEPDFTSPQEARAYLQKLEAILEYLGVYVSGEGTLKSDANISLDGGNRVEVKNVTGFKEVEKALAYEITRQRASLRRGAGIEQETRAWDADLLVTRGMRKKEFEEDYGYIFEPDLTVQDITPEQLKKARSEMPELPDAKAARFVAKLKIPPEHAESLCSELELAQAFESLSKSHDARTVARWLAGDLKKELNYRNLRLRDSKITQDMLHGLFALVESKKASDPAVKKVVRELAEKPRKIEAIVKELGLEAGTSDVELEEAVRSVIKENAKVVDDYKKGRKEALNFLVGAVMKKTKARAEPNKVREAMLRELG